MEDCSAPRICFMRRRSSLTEVVRLAEQGRGGFSDDVARYLAGGTGQQRGSTPASAATFLGASNSLMPSPKLTPASAFTKGAVALPGRSLIVDSLAMPNAGWRKSAVVHASSQTARPFGAKSSFVHQTSVVARCPRWHSDTPAGTAQTCNQPDAPRRASSKGAAASLRNRSCASPPI